MSIIIIIIIILILLNLYYFNIKIADSFESSSKPDKPAKSAKKTKMTSSKNDYLDNLFYDRYLDRMNIYNRDKKFNEIPLTTQSNTPIEFRRLSNSSKNDLNNKQYYNNRYNPKSCSPFYDKNLYDYHQSDDNPRLKPTYPCPSDKSNFLHGGNLISNISTNEDAYGDDDYKFESMINKENTDKDSIVKNKIANIQNSINESYAADGCLGDDGMVKMQLYLGDKNRQAINNKMKIDKNTLIPFVSEELDDNESRIWWDNQDLEQYM